MRLGLGVALAAAIFVAVLVAIVWQIAPYLVFISW